MSDAQTRASTASSTAASLAAAFALLGVLGMAAGIGAIHVGLLRPLAGFLLFAVSLVLGALLALLFGVIGLLRTGAASGRTGRGRAWLGLLGGAALAALLVALALPARGVPRIHDVTTDPADPPAYGAALREPDNAGRRLAYPDGGAEVPELQRAAYPDLAPIRLPLPPSKAFARAQAAAHALGWDVTWEDPAAGLFEARETTRLFLFTDDIVVRVRPAADGGSVVDVRTTSRVGKSDLGVGARRIRRFAEALRAAS